jgi:hypothetical protein
MGPPAIARQNLASEVGKLRMSDTRREKNTSRGNLIRPRL